MTGSLKALRLVYNVELDLCATAYRKVVDADVDLAVDETAIGESTHSGLPATAAGVAVTVRVAEVAQVAVAAAGGGLSCVNRR